MKRVIETELEKAGDCVTCGKPSPSGRNSAGRCTNCHNAEYYARREREKSASKQRKADGAEYWRNRGIAIGETVVSCGMGVFGPYRVDGIAKSGSVGAYVKSAYQRGMLNPVAFHKIAI